MTEANDRTGLASELFGMYFNTPEFIGKVKAWQDNHGGKSGYRKMVYGDDYDENGYYADWDVAGILFNNAAPAQSHNLSVSGNSGKTNYYMSLAYNHQQGIMEFNTDKMDKYNATVNVNTKATDWLEIGARFNLSNRNYTAPYVRGQGSYQYAWRWGSFFGPWGYFEDAEGNQYDGRQMIGFRKQGSDLYRKRMNIRAGGYLKLNLAKGLTFNGDYTYTYRTTRYKSVGTQEDLVNTWSLQPEDFGHGTISSTTFVETDRSFYSNHVANMYFNYNATWANAHHFNVMVGANIDKDEYEYLYYERHAMQDPNLPELALCNEDYSYEHQHTHNGSAGVFGRINYDYKGIYLFEFNARGDASSKFPSGQQWAFFQSGSIGYRISEEPSFEPARPYVSNLKLRASYGTIGNQEIGDMMFLELMSKNPDGNKVNWMGDGKTTLDWFEQPNMVSPLLTWETIATANVGFDLDLFFQGVGKRDMWTQSSFVMPFMRGVDGIYANQMDYVTQAMVDNNTIDQSAMYPRLYGGNDGYGVLKFDEPATPAIRRQSTTTNETDAPIFWLAEIYLDYAEACAELGTITKDDLDKSINLLRTRVGMPELTLSPAADPANNMEVSDLIWEIRRERRV